MHIRSKYSDLQSVRIAQNKLSRQGTRQCTNRQCGSIKFRDALLIIGRQLQICVDQRLETHRFLLFYTEKNGLSYWRATQTYMLLTTQILYDGKNAERQTCGDNGIVCTVID
jgi:hypothetical protein